MALKQFRGDAVAVAQVGTFQVTADDSDTTYSLTINGKSISVVGSGTSADDTATALAAAWNASTVPEFAEITAAAATDTITLTANTPGVPFTVTSAESGGTGTIGDYTAVTAADGPNHWSAANFGGSLPANSDDVVVRGNVSIYYGLAQSTVTAATLRIIADNTGVPVIGLPRINAAGYTEYRPRYLAISAALLEIGNDEGRPSTRIQIDLGSVQTAATIHKGTVALAGSHASSTLQVFGGTVHLATEAGQTAQFATITSSGTAKVFSGAGVTLATVNSFGSGQSEYKSAITTLNTRDTPKVRTEGSGGIGTANVFGGNVDHRSSGTITQLNGGRGGTLDAKNNLTGATITDADISPGFTINDPNGRLTFTNAYTIVNGSLQDITHRTGRNVTVKVSAA